MERLFGDGLRMYIGAARGVGRKIRKARQ